MGVKMRKFLKGITPITSLIATLVTILGFLGLGLGVMKVETIDGVKPRYM